ncbi:hypothetical protein MXB_4744 [Myxobolus squamalis]|nr:hypothetical protein MXB_4744 [Myxobolus squamalis]
MFLIDEINESLADIRFGIKNAVIIYIDSYFIEFTLETLESQKLSCRLDKEGYHVISLKVDLNPANNSNYESLISLLNKISPLFVKKFHEKIFKNYTN